MRSILRPTVLLAIQPDLASIFFTPSAWAQLLDSCELLTSPAPENHLDAGVLPLLERSDALITGWRTAPLDAEVLEHAPRLRAIVHSAGSVRDFVTPAAYERGIEISSQAWANALPVAEYTVAMILLAGKGVRGAELAYRASRSLPDPIELLTGHGNYRRRVGVIGASFVGRRVIELLRPFDFEVVLYDPMLDEFEAAELGVRLVGLDELMSTSDVVSLHAPLLPETIGMIDAQRLALLRDGATFINTARGAIVDTDALVAELDTARLNAVLDVTEPQLLDDSHPLWSSPNLTLTPHIAGAFGNELHRLGQSVADEITRLAAGLPLLHSVPREHFAVRA